MRSFRVLWKITLWKSRISRSPVAVEVHWLEVAPLSLCAHAKTLSNRIITTRRMHIAFLPASSTVPDGRVYLEAKCCVCNFLAACDLILRIPNVDDLPHESLAIERRDPPQASSDRPITSVTLPSVPREV